MPNHKIIFVGTSEFGVPCLRALIKNGYKIASVITDLDAKVGRKQILTAMPVKIEAQRKNLNILQPQNIKDLKWCDMISELNPDLIIVASYCQIIPKGILEIPRYGSLNIHPSLLPKYRGPSPIQSAILNNEKETGATIMLMDEKMDHGPIISQKKRIISPKDTYKTLHDKLAEDSAELLIQTLPKWINGDVKAVAQNHNQATYTKIITKENGRVDWNKEADYIERQLRAYDVWPGIHTIWERNGKGCRIKILEAKAGACDLKLKPGHTGFNKNGLTVGTGKGCLAIQKLQMEGKKPVRAAEFLNGYPDFKNTVLQ